MVTVHIITFPARRVICSNHGPALPTPVHAGTYFFRTDVDRELSTFTILFIAVPTCFTAWQSRTLSIHMCRCWTQVLKGENTPNHSGICSILPMSSVATVTTISTYCHSYTDSIHCQVIVCCCFTLNILVQATHKYSPLMCFSLTHCPLYGMRRSNIVSSQCNWHLHTSDIQDFIQGKKHIKLARRRRSSMK